MCLSAQKPEEGVKSLKSKSYRQFELPGVDAKN